MSVGHSTGGQVGTSNQGQQGGSQPADWEALKGDVADIAGVAVEQGRTFLESTRDQATDFVDRRKSDAAQSVADLANSLRESGKSLGERPNIQALIGSAADGLDQFADTIRSRSFNDIFNDVEVVMRRRPAAVAATTLVAGFLLARFIKSSAEGMRDYELQSQAAARHAQRGGRQAGGRPAQSMKRA